MTPAPGQPPAPGSQAPASQAPGLSPHHPTPAPIAWLVYTNLFIASGAGLLTLATFPMLGAAPRLGLAVALTTLSTLVVYNLDRLLATPYEDATADSPRLRWYARHRPVLWTITLAAGVGVVVCVAMLPLATILALLPLGAISLGYCLPVRLGRGTRRWRLKDVPGTKIFLIALVWAGATVAVPATLAGDPLGAVQVALVIVGRVLFFLAICLPFDVRDLRRDRASGIVTLPQMLGPTGTRWAIRACLAGFIACGLAQPTAFTLAILATTAYVALWTERMHPRQPDRFYSLWIDGAIHVHAGLVLAAVWMASHGS